MLQAIHDLKEKMEREVRGWEEEIGKIIVDANEAVQLKAEAESLLRQLRHWTSPPVAQKKQSIRRVSYISWQGVYDRLPDLFTNMQVQELAGASAANTTQKLTSWRRNGKIRKIEKGIYRKSLSTKQAIRPSQEDEPISPALELPLTH